MQYSAFFNVQDARHDFGSVTFHTAGESAYEISIPALSSSTVVGGHLTTVFGHHYMPYFPDENGDEHIFNAGWGISRYAFEDVITQHMQTAGWPDASQLFCGFDGTHYTFGYIGHSFTQVAFSNIQTRRLFGFAEDFVGSASPVTGTLVPNFILQPVLTSITMKEGDGYPYEPEGIATAAMNMGGMQFGLTRPLTPRYRNWVQQAEPRAHVLRDNAVSAAPFTHQLLFESCRSVLPFVVLDGFDDGFNYLFKLRPSGCMWDLTSCKRNGGETDHALFDVHYRVQQLAAFTGAV